MLERTKRTEMLLGEAAMHSLRSAHVVVVGGGGGAAPPMRARKPNSEKLMLSRLETRLCKVCRVDSIFSHTLINRIFRKKM